MCIKIIFTDIRAFEKFASLELSGALIFCYAAVSDVEWLHEAGRLLLDLSVLFM